MHLHIGAQTILMKLICSIDYRKMESKNQKMSRSTFNLYLKGRSSEEIILAAVVGNTTPDIYSNMWQGDVEAYAQAGVLVPLDQLNGFMDFIYERCDSEVS